MLFSSFFFLVEAFENAYAAWVKSGASEEAVELAVDAFKILKQRGVLKGGEGDISPWVKKPFPEFQKFVQEKQAQFQQKNLQKQTASAADKVFENDRCLVVVPHTYEASCKYGANTKWCTASNKTDSHWSLYRKNNIRFYYIVPKDGSNKFAVAVSPHTIDVTDINTETYNALDRLVKLDPIIKKFRIPKTLFKNIVAWDDWLKRHKHEIHDDGSVSIFEDVNLSLQKLKKLPFNFRKITGNFACDNNQLTSLVGAPIEVGGYFWCCHNLLPTLIGAPVKVGGSFWCYNNQLTDLKGSPREVGGNFDCSYNRLTSLRGSPIKVGMTFLCACNQLTSLNGISTEIGGVNCAYNSAPVEVLLKTLNQ